MSESVFSYQRRIVYADCTVGDHVYYARYLYLLEEARGELFRAAGFPLKNLQALGVIFPVIGVNINYLAPARYDEIVLVRLWITELGAVRLNFGFRVASADGRVFAEGETKHVATGLDEKPKRMPKELVEALKPYLRVTPHAA